MTLFPDNSQFQIWVTTWQRKYNLPGLFYVDLWPLGPTQLVVTDPDLAQHFVSPNMYPKHWFEARALDPVVGEGGMITSNGAHWKYLHKAIAPAFSVTNVRALTPKVAEQAMRFHSVVEKLAKSGEVFKMEGIMTALAFDVVLKIAFDIDLDAQTKGSEALDALKAMTGVFHKERDATNPFTRYKWRSVRLKNRAILDPFVRKLINDRWVAITAARDSTTELGRRSGLPIVDLLLRDRIEEARGEGVPPTLDAKFTEVITTQIKTMLAAGTGTTASTIGFIYMILSENPDILERLRDEHDRVFTPGTNATYAMLQETPHKISELDYTTGVIKEALRFFVVAQTVRTTEGTSITSVTYNGREYPLKGQMILPTPHTMHMDPKYFPNPKKFDPDRWSRNESPANAFRPFERGQRACIGQTLAMDEMRIVLLLTARDFDFKCEGLKPYAKPAVDWQDLDLVFGDMAYQDNMFEARPRNGMPMRVKRHM
ncbi:cytochrome P450 3A30 [Sporormia fimetaria CBS 119925]|uniref:Cytochrome P450 3A30 n=1 Tax=Sporormia fimetaria CBS 119925 TaxID=1340428 RepID=A0A6A6V2E1_9PLEO|nr:cytochrome P450 3A30 [Sporormia fimetaria CBS 119925]